MAALDVGPTYSHLEPNTSDVKTAISIFGTVFLSTKHTDLPILDMSETPILEPPFEMRYGF